MNENEQSKQTLSALMDGELARTRARRAIEATVEDEGLRHTWERYHLIRDVLQGQASPHTGESLASRVAAQVENAQMVTGDAKVVSLAARARRRQWLPAAAAAAVVVAVGVGVAGNSRIEEAPAPQVAEERSAPAPATTVQAMAPEQPRSRRWNGGVQPVVAQRLNKYLVNHNEGWGMPGMHPYARLVVYEQQRR